MALEPTKHVNGRMWPPGVSGKPVGRPVGSRTVFKGHPPPESKLKRLMRQEQTVTAKNSNWGPWHSRGGKQGARFYGVVKMNRDACVWVGQGSATVVNIGTGTSKTFGFENDRDWHGLFCVGARAKGRLLSRVRKTNRRGHPRLFRPL